MKIFIKTTFLFFVLVLVTSLTACKKKDFDCQSCIHTLKGAIAWVNDSAEFVNEGVTHVSIYLDDFEVAKNADVFSYDASEDLSCNNNYWFTFERKVVKSYGNTYETNLQLFDQNGTRIYSDLIEMDLDVDYCQGYILDLFY